MSCSSPSLQEYTARLEFAENREIWIDSVDTLRAALTGLPHLLPGQEVLLSRAKNHYVMAKRRDEGWSAITRRGGWWTTASFTAEMTTEYSERQVRESRAAGSLWKRIALTARPPEYALSTAQIETIFVEYLTGQRFSLPVSGA